MQVLSKVILIQKGVIKLSILNELIKLCKAKLSKPMCLVYQKYFHFCNMVIQTARSWETATSFFCFLKKVLELVRHIEIYQNFANITKSN